MGSLLGGESHLIIGKVILKTYRMIGGLIRSSRLASAVATNGLVKQVLGVLRNARLRVISCLGPSCVILFPSKQ